MQTALPLSFTMPSRVSCTSKLGGCDAPASSTQTCEGSSNKMVQQAGRSALTSQAHLREAAADSAAASGAGDIFTYHRHLQAE